MKLTSRLSALRTGATLRSRLQNGVGATILRPRMETVRRFLTLPKGSDALAVDPLRPDVEAFLERLCPGADPVAGL